MALSREEATRFSKMTISELQVELGRAIYESLTPQLSVEAEEGDTYSDPEQLHGFFHVPQVQPHKILNKAQAKAIFKSAYSKSKESLWHQICVDWDYCRRRAKYKNGTDLANAMVGMVPLTLEGLSLNSTYALAFLLVRMGLDKFCKCSKSVRRKRDS